MKVRVVAEQFGDYVLQTPSIYVVLESAIINLELRKAPSALSMMLCEAS